MLTASTPGAPPLARTFSHASTMRCLEISNDFPFSVDPPLSSSPTGWPQGDLTCPAPSLQPDYRAFATTTGRSAPVPRIGTLPLTVITAQGPPCCHRPDYTPVRSTVSRRQVLLFHASAHDELTPPIHRTPPGQHAASPLTQDRPEGRPSPGNTHNPRFRRHHTTFRCVSSGSHTFVFSSPT